MTRKVNELTETASGIRGRRVLRGDGMCTPLRPVTCDGERLEPGRSLVVVSHEWVRRRPEVFRPYWSRDRDVLRSLARALEAKVRARGGSTAPRVRAPSWWLGARPKDQSWRL